MVIKPDETKLEPFEIRTMALFALLLSDPRGMLRILRWKQLVTKQTDYVNDHVKPQNLFDDDMFRIRFKDIRQKYPEETQTIMNEGFSPDCSKLIGFEQLMLNHSEMFKKSLATIKQAWKDIELGKQT